ncbi:MAG TPA: cyclic nucleotide-binding domain-containing protein [Candidatus Angelobacter sp.]
MRKVLYMMGILNDDDMDWLLTCGRTDVLKAGDMLICEGREIDGIYILLDGKLSITTSSTGREIARLGCGEMVGEISFLDSRPPSASVTALEDCYVLTVPRTAVNARLADDIAFAARFYKAVGGFLADRLRATVGQLGYGMIPQNLSADELDDTWAESISFAADRFDRLLRRAGVRESVQ